MRVLSVGSVYPPQLLGGYEVIWQGVTRQLITLGHASRVLVTSYINPEVSPDAPEDPGVHRELDWYWREHRWPHLSLGERIRLERHNAAVFDRHCRDFCPDVVAFWPMGGMSLSLITRAQRAGVPAIFFLLDPWPVYGPVRDLWLNTWSGTLRRRLRGVAQRLTGLPVKLDLSRGRWVFCSEWMRADSGLALDPAQAVVLSPGIEDRYLAAAAPRGGDWTWRLLYLGRVVQQKGVITAIEALAELPQATLMIIGGGDAEYRTALERRAGQLGVSARVTFAASVNRDATIDAYQAADVVLHPVLWREPWGLVPLEAMACGRPVVATGQGGSADFLEDGVNSLLHTPGDASALAGAVARLAADPALVERLVAAGHRTAQAHSAAAFNLAAVAEIAAVAAT